MYKSKLLGNTYRTAYGTITGTVLNFIDPTTSKAETSPIEVRGFQIFNPTADIVYLKIWDGKAASITIATDEPDDVFPIRPGNNEMPIDRCPKVMRPTGCYAITAEREAGGTAVACEGWVEYRRGVR
jgi:hypothetical protein